MKSSLLTLLSSAVLTSAVPSLQTRQSSQCPAPTDPTCKELHDNCVSLPANWIQNPWSQRVCVAAATCYGVGNLLTSGACRQGQAPPNPQTLPHLSDPVYNNFGTCSGCAISQQNYVDFTYGTIQSHWPSINTVTGWWDSISAWTAFPSHNVPRNNFDDWLHYSSSPTTVTNTSPPSNPTSVAPTPTPTAPTNCIAPTNPSCVDITNGCINIWPSSNNPWTQKKCVAAATCFGVGNLIAYARCKLQISSIPRPSALPALDTGVYNSITAGGSTITRQNYVDLIYSSVKSTWPSSPQFVIDNWWTPIYTWAGFPSGNVPYNNFNDWLHWSSQDPPGPIVLPGAQAACHHDVAITYDDGPYIWNREIVDTFESSNSKTTFFVNGKNFGCIYNQDRVDYLRYAYEHGHIIASHTWSHANISTLSNAQLGVELDKLEDALWKILGIKPALFRPPYESYNQGNIDYLNSRGYTVITWNLDTRDSMGATVPESMDIIRSNTHEKSVILGHETHQSTAEELTPQILSYIKNNLGLKVVDNAQCLDIPPYQAVSGSYGTRDNTWVC